MSLSPTTRLEAINVLLTSIGEAPVQQEGTGLDEEAIAGSVLDEVSRAAQTMGWSWNSEDDFPLSPDGNGHVYVPSNALKIDYQTKQYVTRGRRVYDKEAHSYVIDKALKASIVFGLPWDELPEAMRSYVMYRAGRVFQARQVSASILHEFTRLDEERAWTALVSAEHEVANISIFQNAEVAHMLNRNSSSPVVDYQAGLLGGML